MTHASLFSGIGGPEVAAAMLGWDNVFHCEINPFGRQVLEYWFPNSDSYEDITKTDFTKYRGQIDVLTGGFPCQPFSYAGKRGGSKTSAISGRKCSELLTKSGRLGLLVKMLLESEQWSSNAGLLTWEVKSLCLKRVVDFTDTQLNTPLPSNASALILNQRDIQSSRCLFRLVLSAHHIEGIESSSSHIMWPTPLAVEVTHTRRVIELKESGATQFHSRANGASRPNSIMDFLNFHELLPTPTAIEGEKYTNTYNPKSQMGKSLSAMAGSGLLPTPRTCSSMSARLDTEGMVSDKRFPNLEVVIAKLLPTARANKVNDVEMSTELGGEEQEQSGRVGGESIARMLPGERWKGFPTVSAVHRGNDGIPFDVDSLAIPFSKWRNESLKAYGNAIVPQVMYRIFQCIENN